ncbi:M20/M25/M40 family metallo-hydrolase [Paenibacillus sp. IB182496]|uniref:M20/M25/M40 family metallo-hydrolase n=1 Tax=Paenibacillus sabuli TaxID=2772509 RepID=A0A927BR81_9BACL|nr:M20/M25/M40 family metallo-hydrolase [Paenibacillus sabuli]MBD2844069.1 M20/M25/M40 family metallo-hydrolase [Paenibacillus sabuli]
MQGNTANRDLPRAARARVTEVLQELVRIPSVNPALPGGTGEADLADYVDRFLRKAGLASARQRVAAGRDNVIGLLPGLDPAALLLEAHMDTVQTGGMTIDPHGASIANGRLYGRGACDTKASLAAMLVALETVAHSGWTPPRAVRLAAVVDEEVNYTGVSALAAQVAAGELPCSGAVVGEPTGLELIAAHKGCVRFRVETHGTAGHSSEPEAAVNAIEGMAVVIDCLRAWARDVYPALRHPFVGPPTHCISMIEGGIAPNTVPESCLITIDRRTVPGEEPQQAYAALAERLHRLAGEVSGLRLTVHPPFLIDYAMAAPQDAAVVRDLRAAALWHGAAGLVRGAAYGSDASKLARVGVPSVVFGPGRIAQAHTEDEWVELEEVAVAADILIRLILTEPGAV